jgi:hypothetical protein
VKEEENEDTGESLVRERVEGSEEGGDGTEQLPKEEAKKRTDRKKRLL